MSLFSLQSSFQRSEWNTKLGLDFFSGSGISTEIARIRHEVEPLSEDCLEGLFCFCWRPLPHSHVPTADLNDCIAHPFNGEGFADDIDLLSAENDRVLQHNNHVLSHVARIRVRHGNTVVEAMGKLSAHGKFRKVDMRVWRLVVVVDAGGS